TRGVDVEGRARNRRALLRTDRSLRSVRCPPVAFGSVRLVASGAGACLDRGAQECCGCPAQDGEGLIVVQAADVLHGDDCLAVARDTGACSAACSIVGAMPCRCSSCAAAMIAARVLAFWLARVSLGLTADIVGDTSLTRGHLSRIELYHTSSQGPT